MTVRLWRVDADRCLRPYAVHAHGMLFTRMPQRIHCVQLDLMRVYASVANRVFIWSAMGDALLHTVPCGLNENDFVHTIVLWDELLFTVQLGNSINMWNVEGDFIRRFKSHTSTGRELALIDENLVRLLERHAFNVDTKPRIGHARHLVAACDDAAAGNDVIMFPHSRIRVWNRENGHQVRQYDEHGYELVHVVMAIRRALVSMSSNTVKLFNLQTGQFEHDLLRLTGTNVILEDMYSTNTELVCYVRMVVAKSALDDYKIVFLNFDEHE
jgi:hypothetical protein